MFEYTISQLEKLLYSLEQAANIKDTDQLDLFPDEKASRPVDIEKKIKEVKQAISTLKHTTSE